MSSSSSSRSNPRQKTRQSNSSKHEAKTETEKEKIKNNILKTTTQKSRRSLSLSRNDSVKESPQKSRSVERSSSIRQNSQKVPIKSSLVDVKKSSIGSKKSAVSSSTSKNLSTTKRTDSKLVKSSTQAIKTYDKQSRSPMKGPSGKTNVEIAKSFVRSSTNSKTAKKPLQDSNSKKGSDKKQSENSKTKPEKEETERPRTSTIRKGPPDIEMLKTDANKAGYDQNLERPSRKKSESSSANSMDEDDDKVSYEEDFEDYDSDFEESDSDSTSYSSSSDSVQNEEEENVLDSGIDRNSTSGNSFAVNFHADVPSKQASVGSKGVIQKPQLVEIKKKAEKTFLRMSDRSFISDKSNEPSKEKKIIKSSHSFINFASAVEQEKKKKYSNKVLKRASDLLDMVSLSDMTFNPLDIPPMKYDTFIRCFGKNDSKQVYVQTDNFDEDEVQTDEIDMVNKWTQNPSNDSYGCGGDNLESNTEETDGFKSLFNLQRVKLSSFVQNCGKVFLTLLEEEFSASTHVQTTERRKDLFFSDGYYTLSSPSFLKDIPVLNVYCNSESSHYALTIHDGIIKVPPKNDERGVICVWNFLDNTKPEHILVGHSQPICAAFGPVGNDIVIAGMVDGTVLLWDLSAGSNVLNEELSVKSPTYSTAVILGSQSHHSCIIAVQTVISSSKDDASSLNFTKTNNSSNFHVLTLEDMGILNVWVVVEVFNPDFSGLDTDLGLAPGGKLRLVQSSTILLYEISALQELQKINIRTFDFRLVPFDSNRILITTDAGIVLHVDRQGEIADPRFYSCDLEFSSEVRCIACSPHNEDLFLVGCSDGSAVLYNIKLVRPVLVLLLAARGEPVSLLQWSPVHPSMFVVLSSSSDMHLWNLIEDSLHPVSSYNFSESRVTWFTFCKYSKSSSQNSNQQLLHMCITLENGETEVHSFKCEITNTEYEKQIEFMKNL